MIKKIIFLFSVLFMLSSCGSGKRRVYYKPKKYTKRNNKSALADKIIWSAFKYKGVRYRYGGTTKRGIDCSGLVMVSFAERGIKLPRSSYGMSKKGYKISLNRARRGDLIYFKTNPRKPYRISHVGLVTSVKKGVVHFIHASTKRGVIVSNMSQRYYRNTYAFVKRVL